MKLVQAEQKQIERIVDISKAAFDSDIAVGASSVEGPPEYDSVAWHEQMFNERHLFQVEKDGEIVGGALLFLIEDGKMLYIGRIFVDPIHHRKGYGISLMEVVESYITKKNWISICREEKLEFYAVFKKKIDIFGCLVYTMYIPNVRRFLDASTSKRMGK